MTDTSGRMSYAPFARWDRDSQSWKTSEATSLWDLTLSSLTLPAWGGLRDGELCEHPTPELHTSAPDSLSLPTPTTQPTTGNGHARNLGGEIKSLPTPRAQDEYERRNMKTMERIRDEGGDMTLPTWAKVVAPLLPTPATANSKSTRAMTASTENGRRSGGGQSSPPGLEEMASILSGHWPDHMPPVDQLPPATVALLPTPTAHPENTASPEWGYPTLRDAVNLLPTPTSQAAKHGELSPVERDGNRPQDRGNLWVVMPRLAEEATLPTPTSRDWKGANQRGDATCLHGAITAPPLSDGSASSDGQLPGQLSLDGLAHPA